MSVEKLKEIRSRRLAQETKARPLTTNDAAVIYRAIFDTVCDPEDWKKPIHVLYDLDCRIPIGVICDAIEFMVGDAPLVFSVGKGKVRIVSMGYRLGPAGG